MKYIKLWYYGIMFLIYGWLFDLFLHFSDNWDTCQRLLTTCVTYGQKMESITFD